MLAANRAINLFDFYPRPPRGGRPGRGRSRSASPAISIHALREEGDPVGMGTFCAPSSFLSTPSARRATVFQRLWHPGLSDFYPRPPRGGRRIRTAVLGKEVRISIHALREEGDVRKEINYAG